VASRCSRHDASDVRTFENLEILDFVAVVHRDDLLGAYHIGAEGGHLSRFSGESK
jgi:hypothetical protein